MIQVTFTVRTLTPLFLAGSDQTKAELRAPTFRGLMRYWYRALVGGLVGANQKSLPRVMEAETAVFGATDTGSAVSIRVSNGSKDPQRFKKESYSRENISGKDYLLWSMAANRNRPERLFFPQNTTFHVTLASKGDDNTELQQAVAAFWLLTHLGSIGSRSRRCAGSVTAQVIDGDVADLRFDTPATVADLQSQIGEGIRVARTLVKRNVHNSESVVAHASFDALARQACKIWILSNSDQVWRTSDAAMRAIGNDLHMYRRDLPLPSRTVFGLPLMGIDSRSRRASPLILRIAELQGNMYVGIAILFKTGNEDYTLIENWANSFPGKVEVRL